MPDRSDEPWVQLATRIPKPLHRQLKAALCSDRHVGHGLRGYLAPRQAVARGRTEARTGLGLAEALPTPEPYLLGTEGSRDRPPSDQSAETRVAAGLREYLAAQLRGGR